MNPEQLPLRDIHLPPPVSWWPPAPGWWLLAALLLVLLVLAVRAWRRWRRRPAPRRAALAELARLRAEEGLRADPQALVGSLSALLRRTAMSYLGRDAAASLQGEAWAQTLTDLGGGRIDFGSGDGATLAAGAYRPVGEVDPDSLFSLCERWLQSLPARPEAA